MRKRRVGTVASVSLLVVCAFALATDARADLQFDVYRHLGIDPSNVLVGTVIRGAVLPGERSVVAVVTSFTGKRKRDDALDLRLAVLAEGPDGFRTLYERDYEEVEGEPVGRGELELVDLDADGLQEIVVRYDVHGDPLVERRRAEILSWRDGAYRTVWADDVAYDATRDARAVRAERRDRWEREIDYVATLRTRGITLIVRKTYYAVAGEALATPKVTTETFALEPSSK